MNKITVFGAITLIGSSLLAANSDDVKAAAKKLANESNYSWKTTIVVPEGSSFGRMRPGPTEGKTEKDGYTWLSMKRGDTNVEAVLKSGKGAAKMEGEWRTLADMAQDDPGPSMFLARMLQNFRTPAAEAEDIAGRTKELKKDGDVLASDLTEDGAKVLLSFRGARSGGQGPPPAANAKGSVKFWLKDGQLAKYEYHVSGTISFNGNDRDIERTTTVEIKDVGATKVVVPDDARKKLSDEK